MKRIIVTVSPTGDTSIKTEGFAGQSCKDASEALEKALGVVTSDKRTPEFYQEEKQEGRQWNSL